MRKSVWMIVSLWLGVPALAGSTEVKTVVNGQLLGGQNYFEGIDSSFGGVASLSVSPYMKFNDKWSLVPLYAGNYRGTVQVQDLVGGGTLFQDSQDHTLSLKGIRTLGNGVKLKAVGGYGFEFLREAEDEDWGTGLYDNQRLFGGLESEWSWAQERSVRLAYDYYRLNFPNYQSLESGLVSSGLGRELSAPDVLNSNNNAFTLGSRLGLPLEGTGDVTVSYTMRAYPDQHLVVASGDLIADTRDDHLLGCSLMGSWPISINKVKRLFTSVGYTLSRLDSNQNNYDAAQLVFNDNYYSYTIHAFMNQWTLLLGDNQNPWQLNLNGSISRQNYAERPIQSPTGVYGTDTTYVDGAYIGLGFSYPIARGFRLAGNATFGWQDSNNQYDAVYQYHYNTQTYLMGFTYAY